VTTFDGLVVGSLALQIFVWLRAERVQASSSLDRLLNRVSSQPVKVKLLLSVVHLCAVLQLVPAGPSLLDIARDASATDAPALDARPHWNEAYRGDMSSRTVLPSASTWRPAR